MDQQRQPKASSDKRARPVRRSRGVAADLPIARVCVGVAPIHLDRPFDYQVPEVLSAAAQPGCRVRIRFAGRLVDGFVLSREATSDHVGQLAQLERVSGPPVVTASCFSLARAVADRYVGTLFDVLRMVVPARHARAERATLAALAAGGSELGEPAAVEPAAVEPAEGDPARDDGAKAEPDPQHHSVPDPNGTAEGAANGSLWRHYEGSDGLLAEVASQPETPTRAVLTLASADDAMGLLAELVRAAIAPAARPTASNLASNLAPNLAPTVAPGTNTGTATGSCLLLVPDARAAAAITARLAPLFGSSLVRLTADLGPALRYATYLRILAGDVRVVVGTRAAVFAPLPNLALAVMWDDGDDSYEEPHVPGWHAREVLAMRSSREGCHLIYAGRSRSVETTRMVHTGFLRSICPSRAQARARRPEVFAVDSSLGDHRGDASGVPVRVPPKAFEVIRAGLRAGPVLIQVARAGYLPAVACATCLRKAACPTCSGPMQVRGKDGPAQCRWCGRIVADYLCPECGGTGLRARAVGAARTAEELGRAFPGVPVLLSGADHGVRDAVPGAPALVVATVGAEPTAAGGYSAAVLLDCDQMLARPDIRAEEDAVRRWLAAVAAVRCREGAGDARVGAGYLRPEAVRPSRSGGSVVLVGDPAARAVQAILRADPVGWSERELVDRREARLPPAWCLVAVTGHPEATQLLVAHLGGYPGQVVHGPTELAGREEASEPDHRYLIVAPRTMAAGLALELRSALISLSAGGRYRQPTVRVDPVSLG